MSQFAVAMLESEAGWGSRIDGYAGPFDTYEQAKAYQKAYNLKWNNKPTTPSWYMVALDPQEAKAGMKFDFGTEVR